MKISYQLVTGKEEISSASSVGDLLRKIQKHKYKITGESKVTKTTQFTAPNAAIQVEAV